MLSGFEFVFVFDLTVTILPRSSHIVNSDYAFIICLALPGVDIYTQLYRTISINSIDIEFSNL